MNETELLKTLIEINERELKTLENLFEKTPYLKGRIQIAKINIRAYKNLLKEIGG